MATAFGSQFRALRGRSRERWSDLSPMRKREAKFGMLFIAPWFIGVLLFALFPFVASFVLSFTKYNIVAPPEWVGLEHYEHIVTDDPALSKVAQKHRRLCWRLGRNPHRAGFGLALLLNTKGAPAGLVADALLCAFGRADRPRFRSFGFMC